jgi:hypothetical protein
MSNKVKQIDLLNRNSLVLLAKKLRIPGHTNKFKRPYRNMDFLKNTIQTTLKDLKKRQRANSTSSAVGMEFESKYLPATALKKSKSLSDIHDNSSNPFTPYKSNKNSEFNSSSNLFEPKQSCMFPKQRKIVAIGDIHGDLSVAIKALKMARVIPATTPDNTTNITSINWIGGQTFIVQLGDQIDRVRPSKLFNSLCTEHDSELHEDEGSDLKIICLFDRLNLQAQKVGGAVLSVLGNHELMNVDGDFRYVSPKEFREFGNYFKGNMSLDSDEPFGFKERKNAFKPGGVIATLLANNRYSIVQVGSWLFVHGGVSSECANKYSLDDINQYIKRWLLGDLSQKNQQHIHELYHLDDDDHSPFWSRIYSDMDEWDQQSSIKEFVKTLNTMNVKNIRSNDTAIKGMVMGHSPQFMYNRGINSSANNRIWRVDVGASRAFGKIGNTTECNNRLVQLLVIENDCTFSILKEKCH